MATAERHRLAYYVPILAIVVGGFAVSWWMWGQSDDPTNSVAASAAPLAVAAESSYQFASLDEMLQASDAVVVGVVEATSRGRLVGDPSDGGVISRVVTVRVEQSLWSPREPLAAVLLVEEEGWLPDPRTESRREPIVRIRAHRVECLWNVDHLSRERGTGRSLFSSHRGSAHLRHLRPQ